MILRDEQEQIVRTAKIFGNGAHVFVPKGWAGEELLLVRSKKKSLREKIIETLDPYLDSIIGVYLYGSYSRNEETEDSDIDLFIITDKKIKIKAKSFEIISLEQQEIEKAVKLEPLMMHSIFSEAKTIINPRLIEELKLKYKPNLKDFSEFFRDCKRIIKINEEFLEIEKTQFVSSQAIIYSLVLRLRGVFIIKSILAGKKYSHDYFKSWIKVKLSKVDFDHVYQEYRLSKNEKKVKQKIKIEDIKLLVEFLKNEIFILENG